MTAVTAPGSLTPYPSSGWLALKNLLKRPWFRRIWCIQEVVVAQQVELRCGDKRVDWFDLAYAMGVFVNDGLGILSTIDETGYTQFEGCLNLRATFGLRAMAQDLRAAMLQQCLLLCNCFQATFPEDNVYAVLGIASDASDQALRPDYNLTAEKLYVKFTGYLLQRDRYLHLLGLAGVGWPRKLANLPSWVPDFSCSRRSSILSSVGGEFRATSSTAEFIEVNQEVCLSLTVFFVDRVVETMPSMPEIIRNIGMEEELQSRKELLTWFQRTRSWAKKRAKVPSTDDGEVTYWRTLLCDLPFSSGFAERMPTGKDYSDRFGATVDLLELSLLISGDTKDAREALDAMCFILLEERENLVKIMLESRDRCLFSTQKGYIGLGPAGLRIGDAVCCVDGTITPFLLRAASSNKAKYKAYQLVGETFVRGLMNGEGCQQRDKERVTLI